MADETIDIKIGDLVGRTCIRDCDQEQFIFLRNDAA